MSTPATAGHDLRALLTLLTRQESELHHAGLLTPPARLEALLHPEFFEVGKSGLRYSREQVQGYLGGLQQAPRALAWGHAVQLLGEGVALLSYRSRHEGTGQALDVERSSVWVHTEVGWQLRYHQGTPIAPAA